MIIPKDGQVFECATCTLWLDEQEILHCKAKNIISTVENLKECLALVNKLTQGRSLCFLIDLTDAKPVSKAVREFVLREPKEYRAMALITDSLVGQMVGKIFLSLAALDSPTKLFLDEKKAVDWLKKYL